MANITKTIGTNGRDYSTISAWEADLDNTGIYAAGDDAVGVCYADSVFDETINISGGGTVGLSSIKLTAAETDRHDGTQGVGVRLVMSTAKRVYFNSNVDTTIEWIEFDLNNKNYGDDAFVTFVEASFGSHTLKNCLIHNFYSTTDKSAGATLIDMSTQGTSYVLNNFIYNIIRSNSVLRRIVAIICTGKVTSTHYLYNNTIYNVSQMLGDGQAIGIFHTEGVTVAKNNIVVNVSDYCFSGTITQSNNLSSDSTASGSGSLTAKLAVDQFVSIVSGSEDLHLKAGADAIGAGLDIGTTPTGVNIDIDGRDRDSEGDVWDIGADQYVSSGLTSINLTAGSISYTGAAATIISSQSVSLANAAITLTPADITIKKTVPLGAASITQAGATATIKKTISMAYTAITTAGQSLALKKTIPLSSASQQYTGGSISSGVASIISLAYAALSYAGQSITVRRVVSLIAGSVLYRGSRFSVLVDGVVIGGKRLAMLVIGRSKQINFNYIRKR